jgi:hypothetical protein
MYVFIYIYIERERVIYICVCVCVCVRKRESYICVSIHDMYMHYMTYEYALTSTMHV